MANAALECISKTREDLISHVQKKHQLLGGAISEVERIRGEIEYVEDLIAGYTDILRQNVERATASEDQS